ncbi:MAG: hypothetical protein ACRDT0_17075 [Pseudonocardiaceae bacterium]
MCSHSGAVNVLRTARAQTGVERTAAFIEGLHLGGAVFEPIIPPTIDAIRAFAPGYLVAGHCTGWRAQAEFARMLPDSYVASTVGTTLRIEAAPAAGGQVA